jgi:hypothetical protein
MATTPEHGWPTPDNTDRVADGASAIRALGDAIDGALPFIYATTGTVGTVAPGNDATQTITFPASYFASAPRVVATANTGNLAVCTVTSVSAASVTIRVTNIGAASVNGAFTIIAVL